MIHPDEFDPNKGKLSADVAVMFLTVGALALLLAWEVKKLKKHVHALENYIFYSERPEK